ncbi:MAG: ECF RNA polymerase sigma-E factor [Ignavibacteria bacterium ADurb.Bin266]|jgi:RNA polymerase sigma factor (sigma-70 family)|nr:MAG: ECF RNA polymerase sigma-E factor [Ignavibacteria bacterium ADurb.Bin266]
MKTIENKKAKQVEQVAFDKSCVAAMQTGSQADASNAFNQLYKRYSKAITFEIMKFVKADKEVIEDLTQEVFIKVFEKIKTYDFSVVFSTWLYKIAHNHAIDYKRKDKVEVLSVEQLSKGFGNDEEAGELSFQLEDLNIESFHGLERKERSEMVLDAVTNGIKSAEARQVITLIFLDDMSYEKVAETTKMPIGTIKALMFRAKDEMKKYLSVKRKDFEYGRICSTKLKVTHREVAELEY